MTKHKQPSPLERLLTKLPVLLSYVILFSSWTAFIFVITIRDILIKRHETRRFVEQIVFANCLFGLTTLSLLVASTRSAGQPDQSLAPESQEMTEKLRTSLCRQEQQGGGLNKGNEDDIPLRYLQNSQWVNTRGFKDRPSPLPLLPRARQTSRSNSGSSPTSGDHFPSVSPFPFPISPFVPAAAGDAGEDEEERSDEARSTRRAEGSVTPLERNEQSLPEGMEDTKKLLPRFSFPDSVGHPATALFAKSDTGGPRSLDHHCVWLGTCVGFHNHKPFLLFITYGAMLAAYVALEAGYESFRFFREPDDFISSARPVPQQLNGTALGIANASQDDPEVQLMDFGPVVFLMLAILGGFFALAVGSLSGYHWWLASQNQTTLEDITHQYPSALLPSSPLYSSKDWKADHLLTRSERVRLRWEARDINVYDLGWRKNLKMVLFGSDQGFSLANLGRAMWPLARVKRHGKYIADGTPMDGEGHWFDYDEEKLHRLRELTTELRLGVRRERDEDGREQWEDVEGAEYDEGGSQEEAEQEQEQEADEERPAKGDDDEFHEGQNANNGDSGGTARQGGVKWFQA